MKLAIATIEGVAPYSQSRPHGTDKLNKELPDAYELRTWAQKMHVDDNGHVVIPALAMKNCLSEIAKFLSVQVPGKGKATYTKHFEAGVLVLDDVQLNVKASDVNYKKMFVPADGVRGSGKRVWKIYPLIERGWTGRVAFYIYDDMLTADVFKYHLEQAGQLIGLGTFRVRNNGTFGRFIVKNFEWQEKLNEQQG